MRHLRLLSPFVLVLAACSPSPLDEAIEETGVEGPFGIVPAEEGTFDGSAAVGPTVAAGADTEVWSVQNAWSDTDTAAARRAGLAWGEDSGLDWEAKYQRWVASFELTDRLTGSGRTFVITTPYGDRSFHAPTLECAEVALLTRAAFASWYRLPFYIQGWDAQGRQSLFAGHFGFVNSRAERVGNFPRFRTAYRDYESSWTEGQPWPSDGVLRGRRLGTDDRIRFLGADGEELGAGAYFDEIFLNKRVGHFMRLLLLYFGSTNLADGANMFHVAPEGIEAGDVLLHRWQRRGIGHVMPVMRVTRHAEDAFEVSVASGSMPRREPLWEDPGTARGRFTTRNAGGEGENGDGDRYAALGGGLRRFRTAVQRSGRWRNDVHVPFRDHFINDADHEAIAARPARFEQILRSLGPDERRDVALGQVETAREHLRRYPASCAARTRREQAFEGLYEVMEEHFGMSRAAVDATYRALEDDVLAELVYAESRTCCWNRSTDAMFEIIMDYAELEQAEAEAAGVCRAPTVFRAELEGYARWAEHAEFIGRGGEWRAWSEDETCAGRDVPEDRIDGRGGVDWCERDDAPVDPVEPTDPVEPGACDTGFSSRDTARELSGPVDAVLCEDDEHWYRVDAEGERTVRIEFRHADGDLDLEAFDEAGGSLGRSTSVSDSEEVTGEGTFYVRVYGFRGVGNTYRILLR